MVSTTPPRIRHSHSTHDGQHQQQQHHQQQATGDLNVRSSQSSTNMVQIQVPIRKSPDHASVASASSHSHSRVMRKKSFDRLPLKKTLSSHLPRVVAVGGGPQLSNPYGEWNHDDSVKELQVDPAIYDVDYDDVSEAGSDFTEDYSRHRVEGMAISGYGGVNGYDDDDDDHSSLSSAGSFADEDEDDWSGSSSNASSAVDSRVLQHNKEQAAGHATSEVRLTPTSCDAHHLLDDHTEYSVEEDPLFNMSGALKQFDIPAKKSVGLQSVVKDKEGDDIGDDNYDEWSDDDPEESVAQSERSIVWKETPDGGFVPLLLQAQPPPPPPPPLAIRPRMSFGSQPSTHSQESEYSVDSFAGERTPPSKRKGTNSDGHSQRRRSRRSQDPAPALPLQPDAKLRFDTSDDEEEQDEDSDHAGQYCAPSSLALTTLEEVLVFSDEEKELRTKSPPTTKRPPIPKGSPSRRRSSSSLANLTGKSKDKELRRSESPNPVVPTPISILSQSLPMRHWDNVAVDDQLHYSVDFTRIRISPNEYRAPLKDHSKRSRKSKKTKDSKKSTKKKSPKKSSKVKEGTSSRSLGVTSTKNPALDVVESDAESGAESISSTERNDHDPIHNDDNHNNHDKNNLRDDDSDDASVASQESLDSMDAAGVHHLNKRKGKEEGDKKSKKAEKKKRKKEKVRKRGRRVDYEETVVVDATSLTVKQASAAVADRVEAIFTNLQTIYDKTLREEQEQKQQTTPKIETSVRSMPLPEMEQEIISFLGSNPTTKPEKIRVRSKAAEALLQQQQQYDDKKSTDKADTTSRSQAKSRSKSRSRSISKDPTKSHHSRSKSKEPVIKGDTTGRSRSKSLSRSKSMDDADVFSVDTTIVRRKLKREMSASQEQLMAGVSSQGKDSRTNKALTTKKEKSNDKAASSRRSRSPKQRIICRDPTPAATTESPLRFQDFIDDSDRDGTTGRGNQESFHPQLSRENSGLTVERNDVLEDLSDPQSKLEWFQTRIAAIEQSTKGKVAAMKEEYDKRRADVTAKVLAEKERTNPVQAILLLHKIKVNHYHDSSRFLKKELQVTEKGLKEEMMKCSDLTRQAQEWQTKTIKLVLQIQQMEIHNAQQSRALEQCRMEYQHVHEALGNEHMIHATQVGDFDEYGLLTKTPLFRQWREPTQRHIDDAVLRNSYKLPRSSIFYNVLEDDECRLLFKR